jgi:methionyl-tRNA synthetase
LSQVLFDAAEAIRIAAVLLLPVMPGSAAEVLRRIGETKAATDLRLTDAHWRADDERVLVKGDALWPRVDAAGSTSKPVDTHPRQKRSTQVDEINQPSGAAAPGPSAAATSAAAAPTAPAPGAPPAAVPGTPAGAERISIDDFMKVDLRVAKVLAAEKVPNSRKLVKLSVDVGTEQRTLVAGIAEAYEPDALVGRTIVIVFNLKPAKLMGIESNGMVLAGSPDGGKPTLVGFDQDVPPGSRVR